AVSGNLDVRYQPLRSLILALQGHALARLESDNASGDTYAGTEIDTHVIHPMGHGALLRAMYAVFIPSESYWAQPDPIHYLEAQFGFDFLARLRRRSATRGSQFSCAPRALPRSGWPGAMSCVSTDRRALTTNAGSGPPGTLGPHAGRLAPESARAAQVAAQLVEAGVEVGAAALACELHRHDLLTQGQQVLFDLL